MAIRLVCLLTILACVGCGPADDPHHLGPAKPVVLASIDAMGGMYALKRADEFSAQAVLTVYDNDGRPHSDSAHVEIEMAAGRVEARQSPGGNWSAVATPDTCQAKGTFPTPEDKDRFCTALKLLAHRAPGPINLLGRKERPAGASPITVEGRNLLRVPITGDNTHAIAYYFDDAAKTLSLVTSGADRPGREGTVTTYEYVKVGQVLLPSRISIYEIGQFTLIGRQPVADIQLSGFEPE
jgi:hypothetical protein